MATYDHPKWDSTANSCACCGCTDDEHRKHLLLQDEATQKTWKPYLVDGVPLVKSYELTHGRLVLCVWCVDSAQEVFERPHLAETIEELNGKVERCLAILNEGR